MTIGAHETIVAPILLPFAVRTLAVFPQFADAVVITVRRLAADLRTLIIGATQITLATTGIRRTVVACLTLVNLPIATEFIHTLTGTRRIFLRIVDAGVLRLGHTIVFARAEDPVGIPTTAAHARAGDLAAEAAVAVLTAPLRPALAADTAVVAAFAETCLHNAIATELIQTALGAPVFVCVVAVVALLGTFYDAITADPEGTDTSDRTVRICRSVVFTRVRLAAAIGILGAEDAIGITSTALDAGAGDGEAHATVLVGATSEGWLELATDPADAPVVAGFRTIGVELHDPVTAELVETLYGTAVVVGAVAVVTLLYTIDGSIPTQELPASTRCIAERIFLRIVDAVERCIGAIRVLRAECAIGIASAAADIRACNTLANATIEVSAAPDPRILRTDTAVVAAFVRLDSTVPAELVEAELGTAVVVRVVAVVALLDALFDTIATNTLSSETGGIAIHICCNIVLTCVRRTDAVAIARTQNAVGISATALRRRPRDLQTRLAVLVVAAGEGWFELAANPANASVVAGFGGWLDDAVTAELVEAELGTAVVVGVVAVVTLLITFDVTIPAERLFAMPIDADETVAAAVLLLITIGTLAVFAELTGAIIITGRRLVAR